MATTTLLPRHAGEGETIAAAIRDCLDYGKNPEKTEGKYLSAYECDPATVAARLQEYVALGVDRFVLSGYPHLEESIRFAELVFPLLGKRAVTTSDQAQTGGAFDIRSIQRRQSAS